jgi:hypothetical protein
MLTVLARVSMAIARRPPDGMVWARLATRYQLGMDFHAGGPVG